MPKYSIKVLEYGFLPEVTGDYVYDGFYGMDRKYYYPFTMTLIQGEGHKILFDTGYNASDPAKHERFVTITGGQNAHSSDEILATVGVKPEEIDTVFLSHMHWDHAGATEFYPNATFYIQKDEFEAWNNLMQRPQFAWECWLTTAMEDIEKLNKLKEEDRLVLLDGEYDDFFPGIHVRVGVESHTRAMQMLLVETEIKDKETVQYVLAADAYNYPESIFQPQTPGGSFVPSKKFSTGDTFKSIETLIRIYDWTNGDKNYAVTSHDGSMEDRFPTEISELGLHIYKICD